jgi:hypothetical protein
MLKGNLVLAENTQYGGIPAAAKITFPVDRKSLHHLLADVVVATEAKTG